jgi:hypothetical protein
MSGDMHKFCHHFFLPVHSDAAGMTVTTSHQVLHAILVAGDDKPASAWLPHGHNSSKPECAANDALAALCG